MFSYRRLKVFGYSVLWLILIFSPMSLGWGHPYKQPQAMIGARQLVHEWADNIAAKVNYASNVPFKVNYASKVPFTLTQRSQLAKLIKKDYVLPIDTSTFYNPDKQLTFVITGGWQCQGPPKTPISSSDINPLLNVGTASDEFPTDMMNHMWIRDALLQFHAYLPIFIYDKKTVDSTRLNDLKTIIQGLIHSCADMLSKHFFVHAFQINKDWTFSSAKDGEGYEMDTPAFFIWFVYDYWQATKDTKIFTPKLFNVLKTIIEMTNKLRIYRCNRVCPDPYPALGGLDKGSFVLLPKPTGMSWTEKRPSDDSVQYFYNIPDNMLLAVSLSRVRSILNTFYSDESGIKDLLAVVDAEQLAIVKGINAYGVHHPDKKDKESYYYYEVSNSAHVFMDDANLPSLLSAPYLGYTDAKIDPLAKNIYQKTRTRVLSSKNPYYFEGTYQGEGSPHVWIYAHMKKNIWPLGLIAEAITEPQTGENTRLKAIANALIVSAKADGSNVLCPSPQQLKEFSASGYMKESFDRDNPDHYTRGWFNWPNAFFVEWLFDDYYKGNGTKADITQGGRKILLRELMFDVGQVIIIMTGI